MISIKGNIKRLLQYRLCLMKFEEMGFTNIYSYVLGNEAGVSPEQVRKDFSQFALTGNKKAGYHIPTLLATLNSMFGIDEVNNVILVGMGNIGKALANYNNQYIGSNVYIVAGFDIDPSKQNRRQGIPVFSLDQLHDLIKGFKVRVAIISVPAISAQGVCDQLVQNGISGIMNFSPVILKAPDHVVVNNINLSIEIESILYHLNENRNNL